MSIKLSGLYYGIAEAAEVIGCTDGRLRQMIRAGEMDAVRVSERAWLIHEKEVHRLRDHRPATGRPRKNGPPANGRQRRKKAAAS